MRMKIHLAKLADEPDNFIAVISRSKLLIKTLRQVTIDRCLNIAEITPVTLILTRTIYKLI